MNRDQLWLPDNCLEDRKLAQPFALIVKQWCDNWFVSAKWSAADRWFEGNKSDDRTEKLSSVFELEGLTCYLSDRGKSAIIEAMLGIELDKERRGKADLQLFDSLSEKLFKDLHNRLLHLTNIDNAISLGSFYVPVKPKDYSLRISDKAKQEMMILRADRTFLVQAAIASAPPARPLGKVAARGEAIERTQVSIGVRLGGASLALTDIANLGLGDVITLDTAIEDQLGLTINGVETAKSAVAVLPQPANISLQMTRSLF